MTLVDACRDRHAERALPLRPAVALARFARRLDDLALPPAAGAGGDVDHLAEHRLADAADLAAALALRAGRRFRAGLGARARAGFAAAQDAELDLLLGALDGLLEGDPQVVAQVRPGLRATAPGGATRGATEERVEDVAEAAEALEPRSRAPGPSVDAGSPECVVALTTLRVGQDLVGLAGLLEPGLGLGVLVDVRMPLLGELAEGALDLGVACASLDAEHLVQIPFGRGHQSGSLREAGPGRGCTRGQLQGPGDDRVEHGRGQPARERVLLRRVVRADEHVRPD